MEILDYNIAKNTKIYNMLSLMNELFLVNVDSIRKTCLEADVLLNSWLITKAVSDDIVLAIEEALINIQEHGYGASKEINSEINIEIKKEEEQVIIIIKDNAKAWAIQNILAPDKATYIESNIIGGFGVCLIKKLMTAVKLSRVNNQNLLYMMKKLDHEEIDKIITTKTAEGVSENGIFMVRFKPDSSIRLDDAVLHIGSYNKLIEKYPEKTAYAMVIISKGIKMISKEAHEYYIKQHPISIKATAIVVNSIFTRWMGNLFIAINKKDQAIKLFNFEANAIHWVRKFRNLEHDYESDKAV